MVRTCDMCGTGIDGETPASGPSEVFVNGESIIVYADLCVPCAERFETHATKYLGSVKRQRWAAKKEEK